MEDIDQVKAEMARRLADSQLNRVTPVALGRRWEIWADYYTWMIGISIAREAIIFAIGPFEIFRWLTPSVKELVKE